MPSLWMMIEAGFWLAKLGTNLGKSARSFKLTVESDRLDLGGPPSPCFSCRSFAEQQPTRSQVSQP